MKLELTIHLRNINLDANNFMPLFQFDFLFSEIAWHNLAIMHIDNPIHMGGFLWAVVYVLTCCSSGWFTIL
jgi:hypothetical protein